jgi:hypothetical protein
MVFRRFGQNTLMEEESICKDVAGTFISIADRSLVYAKYPRKKTCLAIGSLGGRGGAALRKPVRPTAVPAEKGREGPGTRLGTDL